MSHQTQLNQLTWLADAALGASQALRSDLISREDLRGLIMTAEILLPGRAEMIRALWRMSEGRPFLLQNLATGIRDAAVREGSRLAALLQEPFLWATQWDQPFAAFDALEAKLLRAFDLGRADPELVADFSHRLEDLKRLIDTDPDAEVDAGALELSRLAHRLKTPSNTTPR